MRGDLAALDRDRSVVLVDVGHHTLHLLGASKHLGHLLLTSFAQHPLGITVARERKGHGITLIEIRDVARLRAQVDAPALGVEGDGALSEIDLLDSAANLTLDDGLLASLLL